MMSVILRVLHGLWVHGVSGSDRSKVLSIDNHTALLHQPIGSVPALDLYIPDEVFLVTLHTY